MSFEQHKTKSEVMTLAHEKVVSEGYGEEIDMEDFVEDYGKGNVEEDRKKIQTIEGRFSNNSQEVKEALSRAEVLEAIVTEQIELSDWLGPNVFTRKASRYDDLVNGVDTIAEIEQDELTTHLALAIDVTHGKHLGDKFERIRQEIEHGYLASVKYFESSDGTFKGKLLKIPKVVLGVNEQTLNELARLWVDDKKKELAAHPIQLQIIEEIRIQLEAFKQYALQLEKDDLVRVYDRQLRILSTIESSKGELARDYDADNGYRNQDEVFKAIRLGARKIAGYKTAA